MIAKLNAETNRMLAQPDVRGAPRTRGAELLPGPPETLGTLIETDLARWRKLIADAKLSLE